MARMQFNQFMRAARACAQEMHASASMISSELPRVDASHLQRVDIARVCAALNDASSQVADALLQRTGPLPASVRSQVRVEGIVSWLAAQLPMLQRLLRSMRLAREADARADKAYALVSTLTTGVLQPFVQAWDAAECYRKAVLSAERVRAIAASRRSSCWRPRSHLKRRAARRD